MADTPPAVVVVKEKRGLGCFGCGCLILVLLILLFLGGIGAVCYGGYTQILAITSPTPATIPTFDGGDAAFNQARQKLDEFNQNLKGHLPTTVQFSADELNTLISRSPGFDHNQVHLFVSMNGDQARLQACVPTDLFIHGLIKGRYVHLDSTFGLKFDPLTHTLLFLPSNLQAGDHVVYDANDSQNASTQSIMQMYIANFNEMLTASIRKSPEGDSLIGQAKSIEIKNSALVIETQ